MSTPEEPPQLTRRQLRELRNTAATPIITDAPGDDSAPPSAPLARAAEPIEVPEAPVAPPTEETDAPASPRLTRREVRQRERLRTASVPVITAEVIAAAAGDDESTAADGASGSPEQPTEPETVVDLEVVAVGDASGADAEASTDVAGAPAPTGPGAPPASATQSDSSSDDADEASAQTGEATEAETVADSSSDADSAADAATALDPDADASPGAEADVASSPDADAETDAEAGGDDASPRRVLAADLGADILRGRSDVDVPDSFDQLLTRGSAATGALSMPNALILSQTPDGGSLVSPVTATGELLITGTFALPDHYGSTGTVPGRSEGSDVDAVLIDGELPAASSPTPIAASSAISTIKSADEIIKPPAPEKGSRLMVVLAITAGVLAVALAGVLILAITTGVF